VRITGQAFRGLCSPVDTRDNPGLIKRAVDLWFSDDEDEQAEAITICKMCPARERCAEAGENEEWGVWGATTPDDRGFGTVLVFERDTQ